MARPPPTYTFCLLSYLNEDINALISIYVNVNVSLLFAPRLGIMYANLATTPRNMCRRILNGAYETIKRRADKARTHTHVSQTSKQTGIRDSVLIEGEPHISGLGVISLLHARGVPSCPVGPGHPWIIPGGGKNFDQLLEKVDKTPSQANRKTKMVITMKMMMMGIFKGNKPLS